MCKKTRFVSTVQEGCTPCSLIAHTVQGQCSPFYLSAHLFHTHTHTHTYAHTQAQCSLGACALRMVFMCGPGLELGCLYPWRKPFGWQPDSLPLALSASGNPEHAVPLLTERGQQDRSVMVIQVNELVFILLQPLFNASISQYSAINVRKYLFLSIFELFYASSFTSRCTFEHPPTHTHTQYTHWCR